MHSIARSSLSWLSNDTHDPNDSTDTLRPVFPNRRYSIAAVMAATLRSPHDDASRRHQGLRLGHGVLAEVEDRRRQHRVGPPFGDALDEVLERADATAGDHRDTDRGGDGPGEIEVEALLGAVTVHRRQEDLARAAGGGVERPP